jgi:hypothetical protein
MIYLALVMQKLTIGCVSGVYGVSGGFIIGFDEVIFTTYNVR